MRLLGSATPIALGQGTNYATMQVRERKGVHPSSSELLGAAIGATRRDAGSPLLTPDERWTAYRLVPDIRACVDSVVRVVSTYDWTVTPIVEPQDPIYDRAMVACMDAERFLAAPTVDGKSWQTLQSMLVRDLMIHDVYAGELPTTRRGALEEIAPLPGGLVSPVVDRRGRTVGFTQEVPAAGGRVEFGPDEVICLNLFPSTTYAGGTPLIETLLLEIGTVLHSARHLLSAYSADEIGAGLLVLAGLTGVKAEKFVETMKQKRGHDDAMRVMYGDNPNMDAHWVEFRRSPKDLDMATLVKEVRRTIWRTFGCKPVTMGDSEATPRATAEVQVEAEDSGLIVPILEMLEGAYNARVIPLLIGDPALAGAIEFRFRWDRDLGPQDRKTDAEADASDFDRGIITANERRAKRGAPPVPGGDVPLIRTSGGYAPLAEVVLGTKPATAPTTPGMEPDVEDDLDEPTDSGEADNAPVADDPGPGEVEAGRRLVQRAPAKRLRRIQIRDASLSRAPCECGSAYHARASELLPSDWQPTGRFKGYRTLPLKKLGDAIVEYRTDVWPMYRQARLDIEAAVRAIVPADDYIDSTKAQRLQQEITTALDRLAEGWSSVTETHYRRAAQIGRDAAAGFTGVAVQARFAEVAALYHDRAMGWLVQADGLIGTVRAELTTLVSAITRGTGLNTGLQARQRQSGRATLDRLAVLGAVLKVFQRNEHRIDNWSGKLVDLSNDVFKSGMNEGGTGGGEDTPPEERGQEWWVEWVAVGDADTCPTCARESAAGFRPASSLQTHPGGATECGARDRCVTVYWTKAEVDSGKAVRLSG